MAPRRNDNVGGLTEVRDNGRLVDHSRVVSVSMVTVVGGDQSLEVPIDPQ